MLSPVGDTSIRVSSDSSMDSSFRAASLADATRSSFPKIRMPFSTWLMTRSSVSRSALCRRSSVASAAFAEIKSAICHRSSRYMDSSLKIRSFCSRPLPISPMTSMLFSPSRIGMEISISSRHTFCFGQPRQISSFPGAWMISMLPVRRTCRYT